MPDCAECEDEAIGQASARCSRCDLSLCEEHTPARGRRCRRCEEEYVPYKRWQEMYILVMLVATVPAGLIWMRRTESLVQAFVMTGACFVVLEAYFQTRRAWRRSRFLRHKEPRASTSDRHYVVTLGVQEGLVPVLATWLVVLAVVGSVYVGDWLDDRWWKFAPDAVRDYLRGQTLAFAPITAGLLLPVAYLLVGFFRRLPGQTRILHFGDGRLAIENGYGRTLLDTPIADANVEIRYFHNLFNKTRIPWIGKVIVLAIPGRSSLAVTEAGSLHRPRSESEEMLEQRRIRRVPFAVDENEWRILVESLRVELPDI